MSNVAGYLWLVPVLPLAAAALTAFLGPRWLRQHSHWPCIVAAAASCVLSVFVLIAVANVAPSDPVEHQPADQFIAAYYPWIQAGALNVGFTLRADSLTAIMLVTVTFIGTLIAVYSAGYMHGDEGYARYFAEIALFLFSMTGLVLADNYLLLYVFWEGVGLCSYLLIGFWFTKPSAADAARKAFLVTRLGDVGLFLGILALWLTFGHSLEYGDIFGQVQRNGPPAGLTGICLLLFCGAVGKSAQFPLHVWLPDAMEGPSPVSALIHAATMVTAGVYLVARSMPLFVQAPDAQLIVAIIGGFTALLAALIALTQNDLKRVLAYSTISQLGFMFLALGSGLGGTLASFAVVAAIFHLFTHAFFKALLFLAAGSVMHAMGNVIDMRRFGGLRHVLRTTHWTFLCGAMALAGVPFLSGFWSKDEILATTLDASRQPWSPYRALYLLLLLSALLTAGLTAFYTFRAYFLTFWGEPRIPEEAGHHAHESPPVMTVPLMILAIAALVIGIAVEPFTHWFSSFLGRTPFLGEVEQHKPVALLAIVSGLIALAGIAVAWWMYAREPGIATRLTQRFQGLYQLSVNRFHIDELYGAFILRPLAGLTAFCRILDAYVVDGLVDLVGQIPRLFGMFFRPIQNGLVQFYAVAMMLGVTVFLVVILFKYGW